MGLRFGPLRIDLMSAYSSENFKWLSKIKLHYSRSNLCRLPAASRGDTKRQAQQPTGPKTFGSRKSS
jgi:hypothetical protein